MSEGIITNDAWIPLANQIDPINEEYYRTQLKEQQERISRIMGEALKLQRQVSLIDEEVRAMFPDQHQELVRRVCLRLANEPR